MQLYLNCNLQRKVVFWGSILKVIGHLSINKMWHHSPPLGDTLQSLRFGSSQRVAMSHLWTLWVYIPLCYHNSTTHCARVRAEGNRNYCRELSARDWHLNTDLKGRSITFQWCITISCQISSVLIQLSSAEMEFLNEAHAVQRADKFHVFDLQWSTYRTVWRHWGTSRFWVSYLPVVPRSSVSDPDRWCTFAPSRHRCNPVVSSPCAWIHALPP